MRRGFRLVGLLQALCLALPAAVDRAKSLYEKGKDAEASQNYEGAYEFYKQAHDLRPKDLRYRTSFERMRFLGAVAHVHSGQRLRKSGELEQALTEFQKALAIDPSLFIAEQEARRTQELIERGKSGQPSPPKSNLSRRLQEASGPELNLSAFLLPPST
jgi:general secretion pathway protein D